MLDLVTKIFALGGADFNADKTGLMPIGVGASYTWQNLISTAINWISILAGIIAFFYLVWAGFQYVTSAGNADAAKKGQQGIINAIIGIVVIVMAYAIVRAVTNLATTTS